MLAHAQGMSSSVNFMPHGMCYLWQPGILLLHVTSDALITLAYFSIPFTLLYFVRRRRDLQFNWMFVCFAVFIVACGTTHLMEIWTVWQPVYWLSGGIKAVTALASVPTAVLLVRLIPDALRLPSPSVLQQANAELERQMRERERAESEIRRINTDLEARVAQRTRDLESMNRSLRESQQLLDTVVDNSEAVIYAKDRQGRYLLINRRYQEVFQLEREGVIGRTDHDLFPKGTADAFRALDVRVAETGETMTEEEVAPHTDGPHTYISVKSPLRDADGAICGVFGVSTDISERKRAEEQRRAQLERLSLLDQTTRAIGEREDLESVFRVVLHHLEDHLQVDFGCACLYEAAARQLRVACLRARDAALENSLALEERERIAVEANGLAQCLRGKLVYEADLRLSSLPFALRLTGAGLRSVVFAPLLVESRVFGVMILARVTPAGFASGDCEFLRQLSEHVALAAHRAQLYAALQTSYEDLRQTQQAVLQQERLRALGQMASGIAHDINNALSPAALYVQSLLERDAAAIPDLKANLKSIQRALEDVTHTVARMREFSRTRAEYPEVTQVDVNDVLGHVIELTRARWEAMPQEKGVVIQMKRELAPQARVNGAESEIRDAVTNLVLNAIDAMPEGGELTLRSEATPQYAAIEVVDTGIGMSEQTRVRCLEPFFTTKGDRGTGLGLAMVYGMTQRHDAQISIHSEPGKGTTVRLVFPASADVRAASGTSPEPVRPSAPLRILIVDDDALFRKSLCEILKSDGHSVTAADGGETGIEGFVAASSGTTPFSIVITDLGMPRVDGRAVAAGVKRVSPQTPVVMLTGWGHRLLADNEIPPHVDRVLSKPPNLGELRAVLAELTQATANRAL